MKMNALKTCQTERGDLILLLFLILDQMYYKCTFILQEPRFLLKLLKDSISGNLHCTVNCTEALTLPKRFSALQL